MQKKVFHQHTWDLALEDDCRQLVRLAVREDLDRGHDWTTISLVPADSQSVAEVVVRAEGVVSGLPAAQTVLCEMDTCTRHEYMHIPAAFEERLSTMMSTRFRFRFEEITAGFCSNG